MWNYTKTKPYLVAPHFEFLWPGHAFQKAGVNTRKYQEIPQSDAAQLVKIHS